MRTIWKYNLKMTGTSQVLKMPEEVLFLAVGSQRGVVCMWVELVEADESVERTFTVVGTGWLIKDGYIHIGTVQMEEYVWHVYEKNG